MSDKLKMIRDSITIKRSGLFQEDWFKKEYKLDVKYPIRYYLKNCIKSSLNPSPNFDTVWYLNQNPDVKESGMNPLVHYIKHGIGEHRLPKPLIQKNTDKFDLKNDDYTPCFFKSYENLLNEHQKNDFDNTVKIAIFLKGYGENYIPTDYIRLLIPFYHLFLNKNVNLYLFDKLNTKKLVNNQLFYDKRLFDIIITHRDCIDLNMSESLVEASKTHETKLIYEIDDDLISIDETHPNFEEFSNKQEAIRYLIGNADTVTVSTNNLKNVLSEFNENIVVIKNSMNECLKKNNIEKDSNAIKIGYMGTLTHEQDFKLIKPAIDSIKKETSRDIHFEIIGVTNEELNQAKRINVPKEYEKYPYFIGWLKQTLDWDIALAPLVNNKLNQSKSEIKYLEYSSLGIAGIYSDVGAYSEAIDDSINGMLIKHNTAEEWKSAILNLIENRELREEIAENAKEATEKNYPIQSTVEAWSNVINDLLPDDKKRLFNRANPTPLLINSEFSQDYKTLLNSNIFDEGFYSNNYSAKNENLIYDYLTEGVFKGYNPTKDFDAQEYAKANQIDINKINPFVHYINNFENKLKSDRITPSNIDAIYKSLTNEISIIIPIYNAYDDVKRCIESVLKNTSKNHEIILINDCSTDERIDILMKEYEALPNTTCISNTHNLGFVSSVNIGLKQSKNDVIILNSDTIVTPRWVEKLTIAAYSDERIATATPFSNNAGAFSVPEFAQENLIPPDLTIDSMANIVEKVSNHRYVRVPTGNGFCMFIKRLSIEDAGYFDEKTFERGYGEENDFCMRLKQKGWENIIDDTTYIFHNEGSSFQIEKYELMKRHMRILKEKYPTYVTEVNDFIYSDMLKEMQDNIRYGMEHHESERYDKKRELFIINNIDEKYNEISRNPDNEQFILDLEDKSLYKIINGTLLKIKKSDNITCKGLVIQLSIDMVHCDDAASTGCDEMKFCQTKQL
ncbi:glycosyltransferase [Methanobrevibacter sp.]|uniref:glycosyltransferase n=1 Tax=Methanobrevibacter sp. TaxID=66852 RepID=UPI00388E37B4